MKKSFSWLLLLIFLIPNIIFAVDEEIFDEDEDIIIDFDEEDEAIVGNEIDNVSNATTGEYGTYENAQKAIKSVMEAYYVRGPYFQYNYSKGTYGNMSPEEGTSQDIKYYVCAGFTYTVYNEAFGVIPYSKSKTYGFPSDNHSISKVARAYYDAEKPRDGTYLIWYANNQTGINYIYNNSTTFDAFVNLIRPGDLFVFSGHALIAYDVATNPNTGKKDVLILNSSGQSRVLSKEGSTTSILLYDELNRVKNNLLDIDMEGAVKYKWLSSDKNFVDQSTGTMRCQSNRTECAVIRPFYEDAKGNAFFNFGINVDNYKNSLFRSNYPGLYIEKTVNVSDNNSVYLGDELTYTIKITNKSNTISNGSKTYGAFTIEEEIGNLVTYKSNIGGGTSQNGKIKWNISSLAVGATKTLTYTVKVKNNINNVSDTVRSVGKFYSGNVNNGYVTTGNVENKIVAKSFNTTSTYQSCYDSNSSKTGLALIDSIYKCVANKDFHFVNFNFENIFTKIENKTSKGAEKSFILNENIDVNHSTFKKMILNNYYNILVQFKEDGKTYLHLSRFYSSDPIPRQMTINAADFKDGDVLIYYVDNNKTYDTAASNKKPTNENGIYAYIFLNGRFVGNNYPGTANERNEFTPDYYDNNAECTMAYGNNKICENNVEFDGHMYIKSYVQTHVAGSDDYEFINYQSLYGKDYYMILRPSLFLEDITFNTTYSKDDTKNVIYGIGKNTKASELLSSTTTTGVSSILDKDNGSVSTTENLKTGYTLKTIFGAETSSPLNYKISVKGDTLGTGNADVASAKNIAKHIVDGNIITGDEYLMAADYNNDGNIKMNDVMKLLLETS